MSGAELGPLMSPVLRKDQARVLYIDHADTAALRAKYRDHPGVDGSRIVGVDVVWTGEKLRDLLGAAAPLDFLIASHVIEHVPDLIFWLRELRSVLRPGGEVRLLVPDRRFTFDRLRRETRLSDVLAAHLLDARRPLPAQMIDALLYAVRVDAAAAWRGEIDAAALPRVHGLEATLALARSAVASGEYHDVHCWVFTPRSFAALFGEMAQAGLLDFACSRLHDTEPGEFDFVVALRACDDRAEIAASWQVLERLPWREPPDSGGDHAALLRERAARVAAEQRAAALQASTSWRITAPLRWTARGVRRLAVRA